MLTEAGGSKNEKENLPVNMIKNTCDLALL